jgi:hypothetical protein
MNSVLILMVKIIQKNLIQALHAFYFDWFFKDVVNLFNAYSLLECESSKRLYLHLIAYRLGGHLSVKIPVDFANKTQELEQYKALENIRRANLKWSYS